MTYQAWAANAAGNRFVMQLLQGDALGPEEGEITAGHCDICHSNLYV